MNYDFNNSDHDNNGEDYLEQGKASLQTQRSLRKIFIILISVGLVLGVIASFGVVRLLNQFGLTEKTPQFERIKE